MKKNTSPEGEAFNNKILVFISVNLADSQIKTN